MISEKKCAHKYTIKVRPVDKNSGRKTDKNSIRVRSDQLCYSSEGLVIASPYQLITQQTGRLSARVGKMILIRSDGRRKNIEKIFKIIRERDNECSSDDEEDASTSATSVSRHADASKEEYSRVYKKCKKIMKKLRQESSFRF